MIFKIVLALNLISFILSGIIFVVISIIFAWFSLVYFIIIFLIVDAFLIYGTFERRSSIFGKIFWKSQKSNRGISITFDDGPNEPYTSQILNILDTFNIKATFFVIGKKVELYPDIVSRIVKNGHEIGNHSYNHEVLPLKSPAFIKNQIRNTSDLIEKVAGVRPELFRAPHGWRNPWVNRITKEEGCIPVAWTLGVWDTDHPGVEPIINRTLSKIQSGCVLLLHDGRGTEQNPDSSQLVEALPVIIQKCKEKGYRFLKLSEMIKETGKI